MREPVDRHDEARFARGEDADERLAAERFGELDATVDRPHQPGIPIPRVGVLCAHADHDFSGQLTDVSELKAEIAEDEP